MHHQAHVDDARGVYVADDEVERSIRRERELADFDAIMLPYERFLSEVSITEDEASSPLRGHRRRIPA